LASGVQAGLFIGDLKAVLQAYAELEVGDASFVAVPFAPSAVVFILGPLLLGF